MQEMSSEVDTYLNFKEVGDINHADYIAPVKEDK
jgi:hypothetical protein